MLGNRIGCFVDGVDDGTSDDDYEHMWAWVIYIYMCKLIWACWWLKDETQMIGEMINIIILGGENKATSKTLNRISCPTPPISVPSLGLMTHPLQCLHCSLPRAAKLTVWMCRSGCSLSDQKHDEGLNMLIKHDFGNTETHLDCSVRLQK